VPRERHQHHQLGMDRPTPDDALARRPGRQGHQRQAGPRRTPLIPEIHELTLQRIASTDGDPEARLFTGPCGGRITTAVLRDATSWDEVVTKLGYEHLRRHDLRHTGLTWMADAGIPIHHLRKIAGHGSLTTTQRYLHPDRDSVSNAAVLLSKHLAVSTDDPQITRVRSAPQPQHEIRQAR
jgi:integrase